MVSKLAARLSARIKAWLVSCTLTVQCQQPESFSRFRRRLLTTSCNPNFENFLAQTQKVRRDLRRGLLRKASFHRFDAHLDLIKMHNHLIFSLLRRTFAH